MSTQAKIQKQASQQKSFFKKDKQAEFQAQTQPLVGLPCSRPIASLCHALT